MPYKYQGFGAGPITPRRRLELYAGVMAAIALYVLVAIVLLATAHAATFKCRGVSFIYTELECEQPLPPATAGAKFCDVYTPVRWAAADTRQTKEQADTLNRIWKRLCKK